MNVEAAVERVLGKFLETELMPALKELTTRLASVEGEVAGINNGMKGMLTNHAELDLKLDQLQERAEHQAEALTGLRMAVHDYQKSVESTVDKFGKGVHVRLEKVEEWQVRHGGEKSDNETDAGETVQA